MFARQCACVVLSIDLQPAAIQKNYLNNPKHQFKKTMLHFLIFFCSDIHLSRKLCGPTAVQGSKVEYMNASSSILLRVMIKLDQKEQHRIDWHHSLKQARGGPLW